MEREHVSKLAPDADEEWVFTDLTLLFLLAADTSRSSDPGAAGCVHSQGVQTALCYQTPDLPTGFSAENLRKKLFLSGGSGL